MKKPFALEPDEIPIADCAQAFIDNWGETEYKGNTSCLMCEIQDNGITSPPEQLWYAAAAASNLHLLADLNPQFPIEQFRVDFMLHPIGYFVNHPFSLFPDALLCAIEPTLQKFVIEIDGFEWHNETPAQAEHDKYRERIIQQKGYKLFRFAAREVLRDPRKCIREAEQLVSQEIEKACKSLTIGQTVRTKRYVDFEGVEDA